MAEQRVHRKLAAILAADVVGFSRLVRADEEGTLNRLKALDVEVIDPRISDRGGRIFKRMGDGLLAEFGSVVDAVRAAVDLQQAIAGRTAAASETGAIELRVGVNMGDVVIDGDDIQGDGVNVAARLQGLAAPGGICVSGSVFEQVRDRLDLNFEDAGAQRVKNIERPVRVYHWRTGDGKAAPAAAAPPAADRQPTLAVAAFQVVGRGEDAEALAAAVRDEVTTELSNRTGLSLKVDPQQADYLVKGGVQVSGGRYRATVQLLDRRTDDQFASDRFDGSLVDLFEAQDELAYRISTSIRIAVHGREYERAAAGAEPESSTQALLTRAGYLLLTSRRENWEEAGQLADLVIARSPESFMGLAIKAMSLLVEGTCGYRDVRPEDGAAALELARQAVRLNERSDFAHVVKASAHLIFERDLEAAKRESERALELNPYYPMGLFSLGHALIFDGEAEKGAALCRKAADANPRMPMNHTFMNVLALGHFVLGDFAAAVDSAERADRQAGAVPATLMTLAAAAQQAGRESLATATVARLLKDHPEITLGRIRRQPFRNPEHGQRFLESLRAAGMPA